MWWLFMFIQFLNRKNLSRLSFETTASLIFFNVDFDKGLLLFKTTLLFQFVDLILIDFTWVFGLQLIGISHFANFFFLSFVLAILFTVCINKFGAFFWQWLCFILFWSCRIVRYLIRNLTDTFYCFITRHSLNKLSLW